MKKNFLLHRPGLIIVRGSSLSLVQHRHHALEIVIGFPSQMNSNTCHVSVEDQPFEVPGMIIAADTKHQLLSSQCYLFLIDAQSCFAKTISRKYLKENTHYALPSTFVLEILQLLSYENLNWKAVEAVLNKFDKSPCFEKHLEPRIQKIVDWFDNDEIPIDWNDVLLAMALEKTNLSESRFLHLFAEQTGVTWRRYVLWRRSLAAIHCVLAGKTLTESALKTNFFDSAHFSKVCKATFGINPKTFTEYAKEVVDFV